MNALTGKIPDWHRRAECLGVRGFTEWPIEQQTPYCDRCPVRLECLEYALSQPYRLRDSATYAGLTGYQLDKLGKGR